jgi:hypothetical protein
MPLTPPRFNHLLLGALGTAPSEPSNIDVLGAKTGQG